MDIGSKTMGKKEGKKDIECNTSALDSRHRTEIWRETVRSAFGPVNVLPEHDGGNFFGELKSVERDVFRFNAIHYRGQCHHRTPADIARLKSEYITLTRPYIGMLNIEFGNGQGILEPGNIYLFNHANPYYAKPNVQYGTTSIAFPASALRQRGVKPKPMHTLPAASRQGVLIDELAEQITASCMLWSDQEFTVLTEQLLDLIALFFFNPSGRLLSEESSVRAAHMRRALGYIRANLGDSELSPVKIAHACGISVSYLHKLFSTADSSVEATVLAERLEHCKKLLSSFQANILSIGTIAYMCGFNHPAHFSRVFRHKFGCTPRDFRNLALRSAEGDGD